MIVTAGGCIGCPDEDAALVSQTITMMREEFNRSELKAVPSYALTTLSKVPPPPPPPPPRSSSSPSPSSWSHGSWKETVAATNIASLVASRSRKPSPFRKAPSSSSSSSSLNRDTTDLEHKKSLWRVFRRRMNEERQMAIQMEREQQIEKEEKLKAKESDQLVASLVSIDPNGEHARYEMLLPKMFHLSDCGDKEKQPWSVVPGGFWEFWNMLSGHSTARTHGEDEGDTVSTSDETSLASEFSTSSKSQASWYSWQSAETEQVSNRGGTRELLMKHFGGENDSPWLAAKRGDLNALENRWKNRHDWTLEDEHGNTPLYYACRYGGAKNLRLVLFLLQQWPSTLHIPPMLLHRCKQDAANIYVQELLINPCHAEMIIRDFENNSIQDQLQDNDEETVDDHDDGNKLYDIFEDDEEDKEDHVAARPEF